MILSAISRLYSCIIAHIIKDEIDGQFQIDILVFSPYSSKIGYAYNNINNIVG